MKENEIDKILDMALTLRVKYKDDEDADLLEKFVEEYHELDIKVNELEQEKINSMTGGYTEPDETYSEGNYE